MVDYSLYLVTDSQMAGGWRNVASVVERAIAGGVTVVQVRDKELDDVSFRELASDVARVAAPAGVPVFVNDRVAIAAELGLNVHIGQSDMAVAEARALLGPDRLIGLSTGSLEEVAGAGGADVIGVGPVFDTSTKADAPAGIGVAKLDELVRAAGDLPAVAIGGIKQSNCAEIARTPVKGICVVSAIMAAEDPEAAARRLREEFARG